MALKVIGPGFGRTGTASLKRALEILGFGPCHHMEEVFPRPEQVDHWAAMVEGRPVDWDAAFDGFVSQVDWPGAHAWRQLAAHFPDAKVVLSVRPAESWWKSFSETIGKLLAMDPASLPAPPHVQRMMGVGKRFIAEQTFGGAIDDKAKAIAALQRRTEEVTAAIPPERLLIFDVAEGWAPLCRFLGVPVPAEPFPRVNSTQEFWDMIGGNPLPPR